MKTLPAPSEEEPPDLVFQWEVRSRAHWRLAGIVALSLLAHAISFYVLQVSYTPTGAQLPPPAQIFALPPDGTDGEAFARWLEMADPALMVQPVPPSSDETLAALDFRYVPSYDAMRPGYKPLEALRDENPVANPPRPRPPGPVPFVSTNPPIKTMPSTTPDKIRTRVFLSQEIAPLLAAPLPPVLFTSPANGRKLLEPTSFLVGVRPEGGAPFVFQRSRSENTAADTGAADAYGYEYLAKLNFSPTDLPNKEVLWGYADFAWGNDIYQ